MKSLEKNKSEIFCPQCGGKNILDAADVKFCRFCGLSLLESRDAVQGFTKIKQQGLRYATWGYWMLQILFIVMILLLIPTLSWWASLVFMLIFALSNGFFIAGQIAVDRPARYAQKHGGKITRRETKELQTKADISEIPSVAEHTTRNLVNMADSGENKTLKLI